MGWGCYRHEWDAGSDSWQKAANELCDRKLKETPRTFGRDGQVCPSCWNEAEAELATLRAKLAEAEQASNNDATAYELARLARAQAERQRDKAERERDEFERWIEMFDKAGEQLARAEGRPYDRATCWGEPALDVVDRIKALTAERDQTIKERDEARALAKTYRSMNFCEKCHHSKTQLGSDGEVYDGECLCSDEAERDQLRAELEEAKAEIRRCYELLWGSRCVYCGETVGADRQNQDIADDVLRKHVERCEKHPAAMLRALVQELVGALEKIRDYAATAETQHATWVDIYHAARAALAKAKGTL